MQDTTAIYPFSDARNAEARSKFSMDGGTPWTIALCRGSPARWSAHPIPCHFD